MTTYRLVNIFIASVPDTAVSIPVNLNPADTIINAIVLSATGVPPGSAPIQPGTDVVSAFSQPVVHEPGLPGGLPVGNYLVIPAHSTMAEWTNVNLLLLVANG